jgi:hypothetical protein
LARKIRQDRRENLFPVCQGLLASFLAALRLFFANFAAKSFLLKQNPIMKAIPPFRE